MTSEALLQHRGGAGRNAACYAVILVELDQDCAWLATTKVTTRAVSRMVETMVEHDEDAAW